jgi:uncharacterized membrane protein YphA (DoxX/SURF4 family)
MGAEVAERRTGRQWTFLRILLGLIMLYASVPKFFNWEGVSWANPIPPLDLAPFARAVYNYRVLPIPLVNLVAMFVPAIEGICALCLLSGVWLRACTPILSFFQVVFIVAIAQAAIRGLDINCGCFSGIADSKVGPIPIARDTVILIGFIAVFMLARGKDTTGEDASVVSRV